MSGQTVSLFGSMLVQYALAWHVTLKTQSGSIMTIFIIAGFLPMFFISPFAGVWADRFNRKYLINIADASIALATLIVAVLYSFGYDSIWILLIAAAVRSLGQGVQTPAVNAFIPQIVPQEHLTRVNGINSSLQSMTMVVCPLLSGLLLTIAPIQFIFYIDVITAAAGISVVLFLVKSATLPHVPDERQHYFYDLKEGWKYIASHGLVLRLILINTVFFIAGSPTMFLTPLQIARKFGAEVWRLTIMEVCFAGGMTAGGVLISFWGGFKNRAFSLAVANLLFGIEAIALGITGNFWLYNAIMAFMGITVPLFNTPAAVMIQTNVENAYMGRVFSVLSMVSSLAMPAGMLVFGPLADIVSIDTLLIGTGIVTALLFWPLVLSRTIREAGRTRLPAN